VSAVLYCNSGTIPKFNRMGHQGAYSNNKVRMIRWGTSYRYDPNSTSPKMFLYEVGDPSQGLESWREGTVLIHNPRARHPVTAAGWVPQSRNALRTVESCRNLPSRFILTDRRRSIFLETRRLLSFGRAWTNLFVVSLSNTPH